MVVHHSKCMQVSLAVNCAHHTLQHTLALIPHECTHPTHVHTYTHAHTPHVYKHTHMHTPHTCTHIHTCTFAHTHQRHVHTRTHNTFTHKARTGLPYQIRRKIPVNVIHVHVYYKSTIYEHDTVPLFFVCVIIHHTIIKAHVFTFLSAYCSATLALTSYSTLSFGN